MGLTLTVNTEIVHDGMGADDAREYLRQLATRKVQYLNGPESPGPCLRCLALHGTVYKRQNPHPRPPLHDNCYCRLISYRDPSDRIQSQPSRQANDYLSQVVRRASLAQRQVMMGKGIARLHRLGIVETEMLVSQRSGIVTLTEHLQRRLGITQAQFSRLSDRDLIELWGARQ